MIITAITVLVQTKPDEAQTTDVSTTPIPTSAEELPNLPTLKDSIENALHGTKGTYGIAVIHLKTNETYFFQEYRKFESASLYKTWILATAYQLIEKGKLKEDEVLSQEAEELNQRFNIASESAEIKEGKVTLSVKDALEKMITISHNYAALLLAERVKLTNVKAFLKEYAFVESDVGQPPVTTAYETARFFVKLYRGEFASQENTQKMIDLLKRQRSNHKLPKYLPQGISIAHKTGELGVFTHDAGIVFTDKGDYVITVLSESNSSSAAEERIAQVSKAVYGYFVSR